MLPLEQHSLSLAPLLLSTFVTDRFLPDHVKDDRHVEAARSGIISARGSGAFPQAGRGVPLPARPVLVINKARPRRTGTHRRALLSPALSLSLSLSCYLVQLNGDRERERERERERSVCTRCCLACCEIRAIAAVSTMSTNRPPPTRIPVSPFPAAARLGG